MIEIELYHTNSVKIKRFDICSIIAYIFRLFFVSPLIYIVSLRSEIKEVENMQKIIRDKLRLVQI